MSQGKVKIMKKLLVLLIPLLFSPNAYAEQNTVYEESCELLSLALGKHTLSDVQKELGPSEQFHIGDASSSEDKVCYMFSEGDQIAYLNFGSNSEMAGSPDYKLTSIYLSFSAPSSLNRSKCVSISPSIANVSTKNGLKLSLLLQELEEILGSPKDSYKNTHKYQNCIQIDLPEDDPNYVTTGVKERRVSLMGYCHTMMCVLQ
jgi:hypothetical protein